jgi:hypothetical protein
MKRKVDLEMIKVLVFVLIALTFFSGASFDHDFIFIAEAEYGVITNFIGQHPVYRIIWVISVFAQIGIFRSYFLIGKPHYGRYILLAPLVYLLCKIFLFTLYSIILMPFLLLWIWILFASNLVLIKKDQ